MNSNPFIPRQKICSDLLAKKTPEVFQKRLWVH